MKKEKGPKLVPKGFGFFKRPNGSVVLVRFYGKASEVMPPRFSFAPKQERRDSFAYVGASNRPLLARLCATPVVDEQSTGKRFAKALGERDWIVATAISILAVEGAVQPVQESEIVDYAIGGGAVEATLPLTVERSRQDELVMIGLYPSGALRSLSWSIRKGGSLGLVLHLDDVFSLIDPDADPELNDNNELEFSFRVLILPSPD